MPSKSTEQRITQQFIAGFLQNYSNYIWKHHLYIRHVNEATTIYEAEAVTHEAEAEAKTHEAEAKTHEAEAKFTRLRFEKTERLVMVH